MEGVLVGAVDPKRLQSTAKVPLNKVGKQIKCSHGPGMSWRPDLGLIPTFENVFVNPPHDSKGKKW